MSKLEANVASAARKLIVLLHELGFVTRDETWAVHVNDEKNLFTEILSDAEHVFRHREGEVERRFAQAEASLSEARHSSRYVSTDSYAMSYMKEKSALTQRFDAEIEKGKLHKAKAAFRELHKLLG